MFKEYTYSQCSKMIKAIEIFPFDKWPVFNVNSDPKTYIQKCNKLIFDFFQVLEIPNIYDKVGFNFPLFRIRPASQIKRKNDPREYSYPSIEECTKLARANFPKNPVFYGSFDVRMALEEMKKWHPSEQFFVVSVWKQNEPLVLLNGMFTYCDVDDHKLVMRAKLSKWKKCEPYIIDYFESLALFYGKCLMSEEKYYSLSAYIAYKSFFDGDMDIIVYPSFINGKGINFAIKPYVIDTYFHLERVYAVMPLSEKEIKLFEIALPKNNVLEWHQITSNMVNSEILKDYKNDFSVDRSKEDLFKLKNN